jgi:single-strand selective monofunctional uracil DNA glycosylase
MSAADALLVATEELCVRLAALRFAAPVSRIYNPLIYARAMHTAYVRRFVHRGINALLLGMNPGPYGMAQTGIPFGEIAAVRDWMQIRETIGTPTPEHPKRPITGLACAKSEVSGQRLWGLMRERFGSPESFFAQHYVANYCPLVFMAESGANITPDKLPSSERQALEAACDMHLLALVQTVRPRWLIGIGVFAKKRAEQAFVAAGLNDIRIGSILHPSPASPAANSDWAGQATCQLLALEVWR